MIHADPILRRMRIEHVVGALAAQRPNRVAHNPFPGIIHRQDPLHPFEVRRDDTIQERSRPKLVRRQRITISRLRDKPRNIFQVHLQHFADSRIVDVEVSARRQRRIDRRSPAHIALIHGALRILREEPAQPLVPEDPPLLLLRCQPFPRRHIARHHIVDHEVDRRMLPPSRLRPIRQPHRATLFVDDRHRRPDIAGTRRAEPHLFGLRVLNNRGALLDRDRVPQPLLFRLQPLTFRLRRTRAPFNLVQFVAHILHRHGLLGVDLKLKLDAVQLERHVAAPVAGIRDPQRILRHLRAQRLKLLAYLRSVLPIIFSRHNRGEPHDIAHVVEGLLRGAPSLQHVFLHFAVQAGRLLHTVGKPMRHSESRLREDVHHRVGDLRLHLRDLLVPLVDSPARSGPAPLRHLRIIVGHILFVSPASVHQRRQTGLLPRRGRRLHSEFACRPGPHIHKLDDALRVGGDHTVIAVRNQLG